ncbi:hypothetical protein Tco_1008913, partial [Tanacetum coccineum]
MANFRCTYHRQLRKVNLVVSEDVEEKLRDGDAKVGIWGSSNNSGPTRPILCQLSTFSDRVSYFLVGGPCDGYADNDTNNDDVGYMRQPIEDESWFLAHEIDYPNDSEKKADFGREVISQKQSLPLGTEVKGFDPDPLQDRGPFLPLVELEAASLPLVGVGLLTSQPSHTLWKMVLGPITRGR